MSTETKLPEFGVNGSVLSSATMTEPLKQDYLRAEKRSGAGWLNALIAGVAGGIFGNVLSEAFGFAIVFPVLLFLCLAVLLYQRFIRHRSWDSILWGIKSLKD